jgi:hypothetical protein
MNVNSCNGCVDAHLGVNCDMCVDYKEYRPSTTIGSTASPRVMDETYKSIINDLRSDIKELETRAKFLEGTTVGSQLIDLQTRLDYEQKASGELKDTIHNQLEQLHTARDMLKWQAATIKALRDALKVMAQSNAWVHFGECRGFTESAPLSAKDADTLARSVLAKYRDE